MKFTKSNYESKKKALKAIQNARARLKKKIGKAAIGQLFSESEKKLRRQIQLYLNLKKHAGEKGKIEDLLKIVEKHRKEAGLTHALEIEEKFEMAQLEDILRATGAHGTNYENMAIDKNTGRHTTALERIHSQYAGWQSPDLTVGAARDIASAMSYIETEIITNYPKYKLVDVAVISYNTLPQTGWEYILNCQIARVSGFDVNEKNVKMRLTCKYINGNWEYEATLI